MIDLSLEFPKEIFAGREIPTVIKLSNKRKYMPAFLIKVLIDGREVLFPFVGARSSDTQQLSLRFEKRGSHHINEVYVASVFPFNFFTRFKRIHKDLSLIVFPNPLPCHLPGTHPRQTKSKGETSSDSVGFDSDIISIRDYVSGDPPKYISWKSTAKTGHLKTKEYSSIHLQHVMIDFDKMDKTNLEHAISCTTFLVLRLTKANTPVGLIIDGVIFTPEISMQHRISLLTKLALYGQH